MFEPSTQIDTMNLVKGGTFSEIVGSLIYVGCRNYDYPIKFIVEDNSFTDIKKTST